MANNVAADYVCIIGIIYLQASQLLWHGDRIWVISCKVQQSSVKCSDSNKMAHTLLKTRLSKLLWQMECNIE